MTAQRERFLREDFSPVRLERALEGSLRRLRFEHVDAVLLHNPPAAVLGDPRVAGMLANLKRNGKVTHFGAACDDWDGLVAATGVPGLTILELTLDLIDKARREGIDKLWAQRSISVFVREVIKLQPGLSPAAAVSSASVRSDIDCVIVGTSRADHLEELIGAVG